MAVVLAGQIKTYRINAKIAFDFESDEAEPQVESFVREVLFRLHLRAPSLNSD